jgi:hypothetical protein
MTQVEHEETTDSINWDELAPECDYIDNHPESCQKVAKWIVSGSCCRGHKTKLCCDYHVKYDFYCHHCGTRSLPVDKIPL